MKYSSGHGGLCSEDAFSKIWLKAGLSFGRSPPRFS